MSDLNEFKKSVIRGVCHHFKQECDRVQYNIFMYEHFVRSYVAHDDSKSIGLGFAEETLEICRKELNVIEFYYNTPYAFTVKCLSEMQALIQVKEVTYEMLSTIASCIFQLMRMGCKSLLHGVHRSVFCRWLWDHWCELSPPCDHDSSWVYLYTVSFQFISARSTMQLPTHPSPIPEKSITKHVKM